MKKTIKILIISLTIITVSIVGHFIDLDNIFSKLPIVKDYYYATMLTVKTPIGRADVFVNGKDYGQTPVSITELPEGKHLIEMVKISQSENTYEKTQIYVDLYRKTETLVNMEIAPKNFKTGYILSYTPAPQNIKNIGHLTIQTHISDYDIFLNEEILKEGDKTSFQIEEGKWNLKISADGYEDIEIPIVIREGYNLNTTIYLLPIPINFYE